jgi:hypothetical protein
LFRVNRFSNVQGVDRKINRQIVTETLIEKKWHILNNNKDFVVAFPDTGILKTDRQVSILYDDEMILINVISFSWLNLKSPFFLIKNTRTRKELINDFETKISKTLPNNV